MFYYRSDRAQNRRTQEERYSVSSITAPVYCDEFPDEQVKESMRRFHMEMESYRIRREKDIDDSLEFAKHYTCK